MHLKKITAIFILIFINYLVYNYLIENTSINLTHEELIMFFFVTIIGIPLTSLLITYQFYLTKLNVKRVYVPYKTMYKDLTLKVCLIFYFSTIIIALLTYIKIK